MMGFLRAIALRLAGVSECPTPLELRQRLRLHGYRVHHNQGRWFWDRYNGHGSGYFRSDGAAWAAAARNFDEVKA